MKRRWEISDIGSATSWGISADGWLIRNADHPSSLEETGAFCCIITIIRIFLNWSRFIALTKTTLLSSDRIYHDLGKCTPSAL
jgi:hypothetical protein